MKNIDLRDAVFIVGLAGVCVGVGAFDWRYGLIAGGVILLASWAVPYMRGGGD